MQRERQCLIISLSPSPCILPVCCGCEGKKRRAAISSHARKSQQKAGRQAGRQAVMETGLLTSVSRCAWCFPRGAHSSVAPGNLWATLSSGFLPMAVIPASSTISRGFPMLSAVAPMASTARPLVRGRKPTPPPRAAAGIFPHICNVTPGLCHVGPSEGGRRASSHAHRRVHILTQAHTCSHSKLILTVATGGAHTHSSRPPLLAAASDAWHFLWIARSHRIAGRRGRQKRGKCPGPGVRIPERPSLTSPTLPTTTTTGSRPRNGRPRRPGPSMGMASHSSGSSRKEGLMEQKGWAARTARSQWSFLIDMRAGWL